MAGDGLIEQVMAIRAHARTKTYPPPPWYGMPPPSLPNMACRHLQPSRPCTNQIGGYQIRQVAMWVGATAHASDGVALGGTQWHSVALSGTQWHSVVLSGTQWHSVALSGTGWHSMVISGTGWHWVALSCKQWQAVAISGNQWQSVAISGTQWLQTGVTK